MTRTAGAQIGCQRPSRFWGLGCPKIYHEAEDTLVFLRTAADADERIEMIGMVVVHDDIGHVLHLATEEHAVRFVPAGA
ncbi:hypothetical protein [Thiolapillus sp.]|uniref:hypothetical protein n=1 Tax=Thiolapillus sp. TaxID=2017437 RepID=UPI003AF93084